MVDIYIILKKQVNNKYRVKPFSPLFVFVYISQSHKTNIALMLLTLNFKETLLNDCKKVLNERLENANSAMQAAQEAANGEEKSSAGDKYETSRAMGHRDRDMYARQLVEAKNELQKLDKIKLESSEFIKTGSLIEIGNTLYFIATGLGKLVISDMMVIVISRESPLAKSIFGKKINEEIFFNGKKLKIDNVV
jgi:hypothetical protein